MKIVADAEPEQQFCSVSCSRIGARNPMHKDGTTWWRWAWSEAVLERDGRRCVACGSPPPLAAHHMDSRRLRPDRLWDTTNGVALCKGCHRRVHVLFGALCTEADFKDYMAHWRGRRTDKRVLRLNDGQFPEGAPSEDADETGGDA
jgi:hypothetical protein